MKNKLTRTYIIICITLFILCLLGISIINSDKEEVIVEEEIEEVETKEKIELISYNNFDWQNLSGTDIKIYEDDNYTSMFGIDVAAHQDIVDWNKVKQSGAEFAYIRLGYRGATEGKLNVDEQFENNYTNAKAAGLLVGVYWYSQPINEEEAIEEANFVIETLNGRDLDFPIAYDFEETYLSDQYSRIHYTNKNERSSMALAFCQTMSANGYETILYTNNYWAKTYYDWDILKDYQIWYAEFYSDYPDFDMPIVMWQYTDEGYVDGIERNCDFNIMFIKKNG